MERSRNRAWMLGFHNRKAERRKQRNPRPERQVKERKTETTKAGTMRKGMVEKRRKQAKSRAQRGKEDEGTTAMDIIRSYERKTKRQESKNGRIQGSKERQRIRAVDI